jgi:hypothetical protein
MSNDMFVFDFHRVLSLFLVPAILITIVLISVIVTKGKESEK